jgi:hypothetical protein
MSTNDGTTRALDRRTVRGLHQERLDAQAHGAGWLPCTCVSDKVKRPFLPREQFEHDRFYATRVRSVIQLDADARTIGANRPLRRIRHNT